MATSTSLSDADYAAQVREVYGLTCLPRWGTRRNFDAPTYGGKAAKVARALGTPYTPWQRYAADIGLEIDLDTGLLAYRGVDITVPRQHGKTTIVLSVSVWRANAWRRQRILYGAQTGVAAREKWEDEHTPILEAAKAFRGKFRIRKANGREAFLWPKTGSIHGLTTNKEMSGHGKVLDLALLDEYFSQTDYRLDQATGPAMITKLNAQKWRLSTAGTSRSVPFNAMRARGRAAVESGRRSKIAFLDWCALPGMSRDDPATWRTCMPMLCPAPVRGICRCSPDWRHTITEDSVFGELESLAADDPTEFDRAYLNISKDEDEADQDPNVPTVEEWGLLEDVDAVGGALVAIGVDITPQRDHAAIVAAGFTPDGLLRVVVLEHGEGTGWLINSIERFAEKYRPVAWALDEKSQANTLILPMERLLGISRMRDQDPKRGHLWIPTTPQLGAACGEFTDLVRQGLLCHPGNEEMTIALGGAKSRPLGDGTWAWGRKIASADISPLYAGTLALAALQRWQDLAAPVVVATARTTPQPDAGLYRPAGRLNI